MTSGAKSTKSAIKKAVIAASRKRHAHPWPQPGSTFLLALILFVYLTQVPFAAKLRAFLGACTFSGIEYLFTISRIQHADGSVSFRPFAKPFSEGHTTVHQWAINIFFLPLALDLYFALVPAGIPRVLLWTINIWLLEVIEGNLLIYLYGWNPAWEYFGPDAYFNGTIKLAFWRYWLPMGFAVEYLVWPFVSQWTDLAALYITSVTGGLL